MSNPLTKVTVVVTQQHIEDGEPKNTRKCPVVLAVKQLVKPEYDVTASAMGILIGIPYTGTTPYSWINWPHVRSFIELFDLPEGKCNLRPFDFEMEIPAEALKSNDTSNQT